VKSKTAVMENVGQMSVRVFEMPDPGPGEVLVKIHSCNICTTDWQTWANLRGSQNRKMPWAPGHEMGGEIVAMGPGVRPELKIGDRVGFGYVGCGQCHFCRIGQPARCTGRRAGMEIDGVSGSFGMGQYLTVKAERLYKMAPDLPYAEIGYLEPLATAIHGIRRLKVKPREDVLIIGAGNLGLVNAQVVRAFGGRVLVSEIQEQRCKLAEELGFQTVNPAKEDVVEATKRFSDGKGMDAVVLAVGATKANEQALQVIAPLGRILFFAAGYPHPELHVAPNDIHYKEWELIGTFGAAPWDFDLSAKFLSERVVDTSKLISGHVPLDEVQKAFEKAATPGTYRVALDMW